MVTGVMIASVYDAFRKVGVDDETARTAAIDLSQFDNRLVSLERRIDAFEARTDARFAALEAKIDRQFEVLAARIDGLEKRVNLMFAILMAMNAVTIGLVLRLSVG